MTGDSLSLRIDDWSDAVNPAVVKNLRQGLRTRSFWFSFTAVLLVNLAISTGVWLQVRDETGSIDGHSALIGFLLVITAVQFFMLPFSAYLSLLRERNDDGWALLVLTGLGARRLMHGKLLAYLLQAALYASAAVPFLLFCYYLNGVDVLMLIAAVVFGSAWTMLLVACGLFVAAMSFGGKRDRTVDAITTFLVLGGLGVGAPMGFGVMYGIALVVSKHPPSFVPGVLAWTWGIVGFGMLALELAVDFVTRMREKDSGGRKYLPALTCLGSAVAGFIAWIWMRV